MSEVRWIAAWAVGVALCALAVWPLNGTPWLLIPLVLGPVLWGWFVMTWFLPEDIRRKRWFP